MTKVIATKKQVISKQQEFDVWLKKFISKKLPALKKLAKK